MAGSWEMGHKRVLGAILHTESTTMTWALNFRNVVIPGQFIGLCGLPFDHARNEACKQALACGADYLFFLDSDVMCPPDTIIRLMNHNLPIVSGMYCRRSAPVGLPVMIKDGQHVIPKNDKLVEVHLIGAGCLLIRRDVLEQSKPIGPGKSHFFWKVDCRDSGIYPNEECLSEDYSWAVHVRKQGWKIMVDPTIRCDHIGLSRCNLNSIQPL